LYIQRAIISSERGNDIMTQVNFRIDDNVKKNAETALKEMGLTMSTAVNIFLIKVGKERRIPFEITADAFYSKENMTALNESIEQMRQGRTVTKTFEELERLADE